MNFKTEEPIIIPQNFSLWSKLLRRIAYLYRFTDIWRRRVNKTPLNQGLLTQSEFAQAERYLYRLAQDNTYCEEKAALTSKRQVSKTSSLRRLSPFLDEQGILRVRGRTAACKFADYDAANPIILPAKDHITKLIGEDFHRSFLYQNHATIMNEIRQ